MQHPPPDPEAILRALLAAWFLIGTFGGLVYAFANEFATNVGSVIIAGATIMTLVMNILWNFMDEPQSHQKIEPAPRAQHGHRDNALFSNHV